MEILLGAVRFVRASRGRCDQWPRWTIGKRRVDCARQLAASTEQKTEIEIELISRITGC